MTDLTTATEAAARAWFDASQGKRLDSGRINPATGQRWQWENLPAFDQHALRSFVLPIVVAVAEVIACPDVAAHVGGEDA